MPKNLRTALYYQTAAQARAPQSSLILMDKYSCYKYNSQPPTKKSADEILRAPISSAIASVISMDIDATRLRRSLLPYHHGVEINESISLTLSIVLVSWTALPQAIQKADLPNRSQPAAGELSLFDKL